MKRLPAGCDFQHSHAPVAGERAGVVARLAAAVELQATGTPRAAAAMLETSPAPTTPPRAQLAPARGPPTDWGELAQAHDERDVTDTSPHELPAIDIHSQ